MKKRIFKYEAYLKEVRETHLIPCPVEDAEALNIETFRWVNDPMTEDNFMPTRVLYKIKGIKIRKFPHGSKLNCIYNSLSLFATEYEAKERFTSMPLRMKKQLAYTHIAEAFIGTNDGESTPPDRKGHFSFFEYEEVNLLEKFKILSAL